MFSKVSPIYSAHKRFTATAGEPWHTYIQWSGRTHATEIITVDGLICAPVIHELIASDWDHNIQADHMIYFFSDYQYLLERIQFDPKKHNILELTQHPTQEVISTPPFHFCGYDIVDGDNSISVLLNCGPFPDILSPAETNQLGLIDTLEHANHLTKEIQRTYIQDIHCQTCCVWGIARYIAESDKILNI